MGETNQTIISTCGTFGYQISSLSHAGCWVMAKDKACRMWVPECSELMHNIVYGFLLFMKISAWMALWVRTTVYNTDSVEEKKTKLANFLQLKIKPAWQKFLDNKTKSLQSYSLEKRLLITKGHLSVAPLALPTESSKGKEQVGRWYRQPKSGPWRSCTGAFLDAIKHR
jgi:hypothetical protein